MVAIAKPCSSRRKYNFSEVSFSRDSGVDVPISGVTRIRTWQDREGCVHCLVTTLNIDAAKALMLGDRGSLWVRFRDYVTNQRDEDRTLLGYFTVRALPMYNAHFRKTVASATICLIG